MCLFTCFVYSFFMCWVDVFATNIILSYKKVFTDTIMIWVYWYHIWTNYESRLFHYWWGIVQISIFLVWLGWSCKNLQLRFIYASSGWWCEQKMNLEFYYKKKVNILKLKYLHFLWMLLINFLMTRI